MIIIYTTVGEEKQAEKIINKLLDEKLIACANFWHINSCYRWNNKIKKENEVAIYLKTASSQQESVYHRLLELHPYEMPAIISLNIEMAHPVFAHWVEEQTES